MDSMIFVIIIFVSIFIAFGMLVIATTIRELRKEVNKLKEENKKLKDENHSLSCSEQSLLWQRENLRNEVIHLLNDPHYYYGLKHEISNNFRNVKVYKNGRQIMSFDEGWIIATKMFYNWS